MPRRYVSLACLCSHSPRMCTCLDNFLISASHLFRGLPSVSKTVLVYIPGPGAPRNGKIRMRKCKHFTGLIWRICMVNEQVTSTHCSSNEENCDLSLHAIGIFCENLKLALVVNFNFYEYAQFLPNISRLKF